jgi:hypothetical protein
MKHTDEMNALLHFPRAQFRKETCEAYWDVIRYYLSDKEKVNETLKEGLDDLKNYYT